MKMSIKRITIDAMLAAVTAALGFVALDLGFFKLTFENIPILLGALLFGPADGALIAGVGIFIYQLLRYGLSVTTVLWILPYVLGALLVGIVMVVKKFRIKKWELIILLICNGLLITALNSVAMYIDSKVWSYDNPLTTASIAIRAGVSVVKSIALAFLFPPVLNLFQKFKLREPKETSSGGK